MFSNFFYQKCLPTLSGAHTGAAPWQWASEMAYRHGRLEEAQEVWRKCGSSQYVGISSQTFKKTSPLQCKLTHEQSQQQPPPFWRFRWRFVLSFCWRFLLWFLWLHYNLVYIDQLMLPSSSRILFGHTMTIPYHGNRATDPWGLEPFSCSNLVCC